MDRQELTVILSLPSLPPSVNASRQIMLRGTRRYIGSTAQYRDWIEAASWEIATQRKGRVVAGPALVEIVATPPKGRAPDLDNIIKPTLDALQKGGALANDNLVRKLNVVWAGEAAAPGLSIVLNPMDDLESIVATLKMGRAA